VMSALPASVWAAARPAMPEPTMATFISGALADRRERKMLRSAPGRRREGGRRRRVASGFQPG
jgi:hypothetical protein